jgi:hypothetical protein
VEENKKTQTKKKENKYENAVPYAARLLAFHHISAFCQFDEHLHQNSFSSPTQCKESQ